MLWERTENGQATRYYWDGSQVIAEGNVVGGVATLKARYIRGQGLVAREDGQGKAYYLQNGHGDVVNLMDSTGKTKLNSYSYDIFGNIVSQTENLPQPFKYSGEMMDDKVGLQYLRARWYDPSMGRFIQEDSYMGQIDNPLSLNLYTYVGNNPLTRIDPTGHDWDYVWKSVKEFLTMALEYPGSPTGSVKNLAKGYITKRAAGEAAERAAKEATEDSALYMARQAAKETGEQADNWFQAFHSNTKNRVSDLASLEASYAKKGAHLLSKHSGKTNEFLYNRIKNSHSIPSSTSFMPGEAQKAVNSIVADEGNAKQIASWLANGKSATLDLSYVGNGVDPIGYGYVKGASSIDDVQFFYNAKITLKMDNNDSFFILTGELTK
ncbi:RHS repeat-associated core domain-containing protein [Paenibacillus sp. SYP-B3998]|uniref:RHS repeat-associated core domain-containing protein n=1 Tax=Paenibacillus sp. SYP-B3998 TaxID=2678564 RepID=A0A6G3ZR58_9BACL|nr:RHS repeat-associated core domain-containing protein [Paenibacillus sp. SYP-B3998]NEW04693.1 RHS repeat-associated core domain-containing protein [Paenibacillus sp. SYP-B3998]